MESGAQGSPCTYCYTWAPFRSPGIASGIFIVRLHPGEPAGVSFSQALGLANRKKKSLSGYELSAAIGQRYSIGERDAFRFPWVEPNI